MKKVLGLILIVLPFFAFADNMTFAKKLVIEDIEKYASDYGVSEILEVKEIGFVNKQYSFMVTYSKKFCWDTGDDERMSCAEYSCASQADVDSDAIVGFETENDRKKCTKIQDTDTTELY